MRDLNHVIVLGRLVRDPELIYTSSGTAVAKISIAVNDSYTSNGTKKENTSFFDVNVWGVQGENCSKYLKKGSQVAVEGSLRQNKWEDKTTGKTNSKIEIVANSVQFLTLPKVSNPPPAPKDGEYIENPWNDNKTPEDVPF